MICYYYCAEKVKSALVEKENFMNKRLRHLTVLPVFRCHVDPRGGLSSPSPPRPPTLTLFFFSWKGEVRPDFLAAERWPAVLHFRLEANGRAEVSEEWRGG